MRDRQYARDAGDLPEGSSTHLRRMKSAEEMAWAAVASEGSKSSLVLQVCIKMLTEKLLPWITEYFETRYISRRCSVPHIEFDTAVV